MNSVSQLAEGYMFIGSEAIGLDCGFEDTYLDTYM